jgi:hypothetical protein
MKKFCFYVIALFGAYAAAWTLSYVGVFLSRGDGLDLRYFFSYLALAWSFQAGELPGFVWLFSLAAFLLFAPLAIVVVRRLVPDGAPGEKITSDATRTI